LIAAITYEVLTSSLLSDVQSEIAELCLKLQLDEVRKALAKAFTHKAYHFL